MEAMLMNLKENEDCASAARMMECAPELDFSTGDQTCVEPLSEKENKGRRGVCITSLQLIDW